MRLFLTGATGLVGQRLCPWLLAEGHQLTVLSRSKARAQACLPEQVSVVEGDPLTPGAWYQAMAGVDGVIHLAGEPIGNQPWTPEAKARFRSSRVESTRNIVKALGKLEPRPGILLCASAVGRYGDRGDTLLDESSPVGKGFLAELCQAWEEAALEAEDMGVRVVLLRLGVVLDRKGGALPQLERPMRFFLGGAPGGGKQWLPWVHMADVLGLVGMALEDEELSGALNVVAPEPHTMGSFCETLGRVLHRPCWVPIPAGLLSRVLGERAAIVLDSQRVAPRRALQAGYAWRFSSLEAGLQDLYRTVNTGKKA